MNLNNFFHRFTSFICAMSFVLFSQSQVIASDQVVSYETQKILDQFEQLLDPALSAERADFTVRGIVGDLKELNKKEKIETISQLSQKMKTQSLQKLISLYNIKDEEIQNYSEQIANRLVALGIAFDKSIRTDVAGLVFLNAILGALAAGIISFSIFARSGRLTPNTMTMQVFITNVSIFGGAMLGAGGTILISKMRGAFLKSKTVEEFKITLKEEVEKMKQTQNIVQELE